MPLLQASKTYKPFEYPWVLVTHEPDIAQYAKRVIVVRDGLIRNDQAIVNRRDAATELESMPAVDQEVEAL